MEYTTFDDHESEEPRRRLWNPLDWEQIDRVAFLAGVSLAVVLVAVSLNMAILEDPSFAPRIDASVVKRVILTDLIGGCVAATVLIGALFLRRRIRRSEILPYVLLTPFGILCGLLRYQLYPYGDTAWIAIITYLLVGTVLFGAGPVIVCVLTFLIIMEGLHALLIAGVELPSFLELRSILNPEHFPPPPIDLHWAMSGDALSGFLLISMLAIGVALTVRWRRRETELAMAFAELAGVRERQEAAERELRRLQESDPEELDDEHWPAFSLQGGISCRQLCRILAEEYPDAKVTHDVSAAGALFPQRALTAIVGHLMARARACGGVPEMSVHREDGEIVFTVSPASIAGRIPLQQAGAQFGLELADELARQLGGTVQFAGPARARAVQLRLPAPEAAVA